MSDDLPVVVLEHAGAKLEGRVAVPDGVGRDGNGSGGGGRDGKGPVPAVLVMPSAQGLGQHVREVAGKLAREGYIALAVDMYGNGVHFSQPDGCGPSIIPLMQDPQLLRGRLTGWLEKLCSLPNVDAQRVAAIGYCFGGQCALELARSGAALRAAVSYHGLLSTALPAAPGAVKAKLAIYSGAKDPWAPRHDVTKFEDEMRAAGASWQITVFGDAYHAFTMEEDADMPLEGLGYDALADALAWAGTLTLLRHVLK